jgi:hypothetical protein
MSIPTNASKFLPECFKDSLVTADTEDCFFLGSGLVVDRVLGRFFSVNGPWFGGYCVAGWYSSAFRPALGVITDEADRETIAGLTDLSAEPSNDLLSSTDSSAVPSIDLLSSTDSTAEASDDWFFPTDPSAEPSNDLFYSTNIRTVASDDLFSSTDPSHVPSDDFLSAATAIFLFKSSTI